MPEPDVAYVVGLQFWLSVCFRRDVINISPQWIVCREHHASNTID